MGLNNPIAYVPVFQDFKQVTSLAIPLSEIEKLIFKFNLEAVSENSLAFYTCVDFPLLVVVGMRGKKRVIACLRPIFSETDNFHVVLKKVYDQYRSKEITARDVANAIDLISDEIPSSQLN